MMHYDEILKSVTICVILETLSNVFRMIMIVIVGRLIQRHGPLYFNSNTMASKPVTSPAGKGNQHLYIVWGC